MHSCNVSSPCGVLAWEYPGVFGNGGRLASSGGDGRSPTSTPTFPPVVSSLSNRAASLFLTAIYLTIFKLLVVIMAYSAHDISSRGAENASRTAMPGSSKAPGLARLTTLWELNSVQQQYPLSRTQSQTVALNQIEESWSESPCDDSNLVSAIVQTPTLHDICFGSSTRQPYYSCDQWFADYRSTASPTPTRSSTPASPAATVVPGHSLRSVSPVPIRTEAPPARSNAPRNPPTPSPTASRSPTPTPSVSASPSPPSNHSGSGDWDMDVDELASVSDSDSEFEIGPTKGTRSARRSKGVANRSDRNTIGGSSTRRAASQHQPFVCNCHGRIYNRKGDMERHMRETELPEVCHGCDQRFKRKDPRTRHWDADWNPQKRRNLDSPKLPHCEVVHHFKLSGNRKEVKRWAKRWDKFTPSQRRIATEELSQLLGRPYPGPEPIETSAPSRQRKLRRSSTSEEED